MNVDFKLSETLKLLGVQVVHLDRRVETIRVKYFPLFTDYH
jgi:hypothetical protein